MLRQDALEEDQNYVRFFFASLYTICSVSIIIQLLQKVYSLSIFGLIENIWYTT